MICEVVWVLRGAYCLVKEELVDVLDRLLATSQLFIEDREAVRRAFADFRTGPGDLADDLLGQGNREVVCPATATFDRKLKKNKLFQVL